MLDFLGQIFTGIDTSFRGQVLVPMALVAFLVVGGIWMIGNQRSATEKAIAAVIGMAVILAAPRIVAAIQGVVH